MAGTSINRRTVEALLNVRLQSGLNAIVATHGTDYVGPGQPTPNLQNRSWSRIVRIDLVHQARQSGTAELERAEGVCIVHVTCPPSVTELDAYEISAACARVSTSMSERRLIDTPLTTVLTTRLCDTQIDAPIDEEPGLRTAMVMVPFTAEAVA